MTRSKKAALWLVSLVVLSVAGSWAYVVSRTFADFESLLLCSQGKDTLLPKSICQSYLFRFGAEAEDIAALNRGTGVGWVVRAEDEDDRKKLVAFLLQSGVDINAIDQRSGISALHTAVLENDLAAVELLLSNGANPAVRDRDHGRTPLAFALDLESKPNQPDRGAIIQRLRAASQSGSPGNP